MQNLPYYIDIHILIFIASIFMFMSVKRADYISEGYSYIRMSFLLLAVYVVDDFFITLTQEGFITPNYSFQYYLYAFYIYVPAILTFVFYKYCGGVIGHFNRPVRSMMHSLFFLDFLSYIVVVAIKDTELFAYPDPNYGGMLVGLMYYICALIAMLPFVLLLIASVLYYLNKENYGVREVIIPVIVFAVIPMVFAIAEAILGTNSSFALVGLAIAEMFLYTHTIVLSVNSDDLTGLFNKRQMLKDADYLIRNHIPWGVIMIDANRFKSINDEFGHSEGDHAIRLISNVLESVVDRNDSRAYRFGGDEFVILLSKEAINDADNIIRMIDMRLEKKNNDEILPYILSVSSGYETYDEENDSSISDVLARADDKMYKDKKIRKGEANFR